MVFGSVQCWEQYQAAMRFGRAWPTKGFESGFHWKHFHTAACCNLTAKLQSWRNAELVSCTLSDSIWLYLYFNSILFWVFGLGKDIRSFLVTSLKSLWSQVDAQVSIFVTNSKLKLSLVTWVHTTVGTGCMFQIYTTHCQCFDCHKPNVSHILCW